MSSWNNWNPFGVNPYNRDPWSRPEYRDPFSHMLPGYENMWNLPQLSDPFRGGFIDDQFGSSTSDQEFLRGSENSYVTKINYDRDGNPVKEVLHTKISSVNDKGKKIVEKEKRYVNEAIGEEKISKERILGDKAHKIVTIKSKNRPEQSRTYFKGGLREDQLDSFNKEYESVRHHVKLPQVTGGQQELGGVEQQQPQQSKSELERAFEQHHEGYVLGSDQPQITQEKTPQISQQQIPSQSQQSQKKS